MCIFISILQMKQVSSSEAKWFYVKLQLTFMSSDSKYSSLSYQDVSFNLYL